MTEQNWVYSDIVKDHFLNPRNFLMGDESKYKYDAKGIVGNPICGDQMLMFIQVENDKIIDVKWKTYGCASAIASTSALSELAKGKTLKEAENISAEEIAEYLGGLPKHKFMFRSRQSSAHRRHRKLPTKEEALDSLSPPPRGFSTRHIPRHSR